MVFYVSECLNTNSLRRAKMIYAKNLNIAKMIASKIQTFQNTVLIIGTNVNEDGFILEPVTIKKDNKWQYI